MHLGGAPTPGTGCHLDIFRYMRLTRPCQIQIGSEELRRPQCLQLNNSLGILGQEPLGICRALAWTGSATPRVHDLRRACRKINHPRKFCLDNKPFLESIFNHLLHKYSCITRRKASSLVSAKRLISGYSCRLESVPCTQYPDPERHHGCSGERKFSLAEPRHPTFIPGTFRY